MPLVFQLKACKLPSQKIFNPYLMQRSRQKRLSCLKLFVCLFKTHSSAHLFLPSFRSSGTWDFILEETLELRIGLWEVCESVQPFRWNEAGLPWSNYPIVFAGRNTVSHFNNIDIIHAESYWQNIRIFTSFHCNQLFMVKVAITGGIYLATL